MPSQFDAEFRLLASVRLQDREMGLCRCPDAAAGCGVHDPAFRDARSAYVSAASSSDSIVDGIDAETLDRAAREYSADYNHDRHSDACWPTC